MLYLIDSLKENANNFKQSFACNFIISKIIINNSQDIFDFLIIAFEKYKYCWLSVNEMDLSQENKSDSCFNSR